MKTSVKIVKFLILLTVAFLFLSYSISLNEENRWIMLNISWLSNRFLFAIVSGSFASLLVVLACELQKYHSIKRQTEDFVFGQLFFLYSQIIIIHYNIKRQLYDISSPVPNNLIDEISNRGKMYLTSLASIEYITFCRHNPIEEQLIQYRGDGRKRINLFLQNSVFLKMAINEDRIALLKQGKDKLITSQNPKTHQTLKKIFDDSTPVLSYIEKSLDIIDNECKKRYYWNELKRNVIIGEENFVSADLNLYLKQPIINFNKEEI